MKTIGTGISSAVLTLLITVGTANAGVVTRTYGFNFGFPTGSPYQTVTGSFKISFDPSINYNTGSSLIYFKSSLPPSYGTFTFSNYVPSPGSTASLLDLGDNSFGNSQPDQYYYVGGKDNAFISINVDSFGNPIINSGMAYSSTVSNTASFQSTSGTVKLVPEPGSLALLGTGLLGLGLVIRRNRVRV